MHPRTQATLKQLDVRWFRSVGEKRGPEVKVLSSWDEAIQSCSSEDWQELIVEAANRQRSLVLKASADRYRDWNNLANELRPVVIDFVEGKTKEVVQAHSLPVVFVDTVKWDMIHLLLEAEYADIVPASFFAAHGYWYAEGHFPCGAEGRPPLWRPIIF